MTNGPSETPDPPAQAVAADHSVKEPTTFSVAPSNSAQEHVNTLVAPLTPWACWKIESICFEFNSAFVKPDARDPFIELIGLVKKHPKAPLAIFGHADPVGNDEYNKDLSEHRACAVYAVLARKVDLWEKLYGHSNEQVRFLQNNLAALGHDPGPIDGQMGNKTKAAISSFEQAEGFPETGQNTASMRANLFKTYMDWLCPDLTLEDSDFLGNGECAYQGCGEFNPLRMFSKEQNAAFQQEQNKAERNKENEVNRRVIAFLFKPGTTVDLDKWFCKSDAANCHKRFWSDWKQRRSFQAIGREQQPRGKGPTKKPSGKWNYDLTQDTFACRFYQRIAGSSPCEQPGQGEDPQVQFEIYGFDIPVCGLKCEIKRNSEKKTPAQQKPELVVLNYVGAGAGAKVDHFGDKLSTGDVDGNQFDVVSSRKMVMKASGTHPLGKTMHGDAVKYDPNYYPSEMENLVPYFTYSEASYQEKCSIFKSMQERSYLLREMVVLWDKQTQKIKKCMLDGVEIPVD